MKKLFFGICVLGILAMTKMPAFATITRHFECFNHVNHEMLKEFYSSHPTSDQALAWYRKHGCVMTGQTGSPTPAGPKLQCVVTVGADQNSHKKWNLVGKSAALGTHPVPGGGSITVSAQGQFTLAGGAKISRTHKC